MEGGKRENEGKKGKEKEEIYLNGVEFIGKREERRDRRKRIKKKRWWRSAKKMKDVRIRA